MALQVNIKYLTNFTVWKFHDFYITKILREIRCRDFRSAKSAILTTLGALNFEFYEFLHFLNAEISKLTQFRDPKIVEKAVEYF